MISHFPVLTCFLSYCYVWESTSSIGESYIEENIAKNRISVIVKSDCLWLFLRALGSL